MDLKNVDAILRDDSHANYLDQNFVFIDDEIYTYNGIIYLIKLRKKQKVKRVVYFKDFYNFFQDSEILEKSLKEKYELFNLILNELYLSFLVNINTHTILSISSVSYNIFRKAFPDKFKLIPTFNSGLDDYIRPSFFGGRTEIYKPITENNNSYYYDINSLYPFIMKTKKFPLGLPTKYDKASLNALDIKDYFGFLDIELYLDENLNVLPVLPIRAEQYEENILYPTGTIRGVYFTEEINLALAVGYKIIQIHSGYLYNNKGLIFDTFVDTIYSYRQKYKKVSPILNKLYKTIGNVVYGRLACIYERTEYFQAAFPVTQNSMPELIGIEKIKYMNVGLASAISSYARIYMYNKLKSLGLINALLYWDTDGIFLNRPLPINEVNSDSLGAFRLEDEIISCYFISPKFYMYLNTKYIKHYVFRGLPTEEYILNFDEIKESFIKTLVNSLQNTYLLFELNAVYKPTNLIEKKPFRFFQKRRLFYDKANNIFNTTPYKRKIGKTFFVH